MEIRVRVNLAMVIAVVMAELMSTFWYRQRRIGDRFFLTAVFCDMVLVLLLKIMIDTVYVNVSTWMDIAIVAAFIALVYFCLDAPNIVSNSDTFLYCFLHSTHKFCVVFVMIFCMEYFKNY